MVRMFSLSLATLGFFCLAWAEPAIVIKTPMPPPAWALLERDLLRFNSEAVERFADKYVDDKGYLLHTIRWGTLDGPDDAIETFYQLDPAACSGRVRLGPESLQKGARRPLEAVRRAADDADQARGERRVLQRIHHAIRLVPHGRGHARLPLPGFVRSRTTASIASG